MKSLQNHIKSNTDIYFTKTRSIVKENSPSCKVIYAVFLRYPCIYACEPAINFIKEAAEEQNKEVNIIENYKTGDLVEEDKVLFFIEGELSFLSELETLILQNVGLPAICAYNAFHMSTSLPNAKFISMLARHCTGEEMVKLADYGVSVGSKKAKENGAVGFVATSVHSSSEFFNSPPFGTMPHALIGFAGSTLKAAEMYRETFPDETLTVLIDYFGKEIDDTLAVCERFKDLHDAEKLSVRIDTHKKRYAQGLDHQKSCELIKKHCGIDPEKIEDEKERTYLIGKGVSAASILHMKEALIANNFPKAKVVASSGFSIDKCNVFGKYKIKVDAIGTGSTLPSVYSKSYATADIICYNEKFSVKQGRENLIEQWNQITNK